MKTHRGLGGTPGGRGDSSSAKKRGKNLKGSLQQRGMANGDDLRKLCFGSSQKNSRPSQKEIITYSPETLYLEKNWKFGVSRDKKWGFDAKTQGKRRLDLNCRGEGLRKNRTRCRQD